LGEMFDKMENENDYPNKIMFSHKATFHLSGKVYRHIVRVWGRENPHEIVEYVWDSPKLNVFRVVSSAKMYGPFFFAEPTATGISYLDMLETISCHSYSKIWTEISFFNKMGHPRTSMAKLLPTSIPLWLLGLDVVERWLGHHDRLI